MTSEPEPTEPLEDHVAAAIDIVAAGYPHLGTETDKARFMRTLEVALAARAPIVKARDLVEKAKRPPAQ